SEGLPQIIIEVRKEAQVRRQRFQIAQVKPLLGKIADQVSGTRIREHSPHLPLEHAGLMELAANRSLEQLIVRDAAPQEEGKARRQRQIADAINRVRRRSSGVLFDSEQELGADQDRA